MRSRLEVVGEDRGELHSDLFERSWFDATGDATEVCCERGSSIEIGMAHHGVQGWLLGNRLDWRLFQGLR
jgi:hypothetical protein